MTISQFQTGRPIHRLVGSIHTDFVQMQVNEKFGVYEQTTSMLSSEIIEPMHTWRSHIRAVCIAITALCHQWPHCCCICSSLTRWFRPYSDQYHCFPSLLVILKMYEFLYSSVSPVNWCLSTFSLTKLLFSLVLTCSKFTATLSWFLGAWAVSDNHFLYLWITYRVVTCKKHQNKPFPGLTSAIVYVSETQI
jgi:hypothetical protein